MRADAVRVSSGPGCGGEGDRARRRRLGALATVEERHGQDQGESSVAGGEARGGRGRRRYDPNRARGGGVPSAGAGALGEGVPRAGMPGDALHLRLAPDPASDERGPRERRRRAGRALAPRRVRGVGGTASDATRAGSRPTHGQPSGRARCVRRSRARSPGAPGGTQSRGDAKGAHRALLATRPRCAQHPRAPARPRPRVPSGTLSSASRSSDAPRRDAALSVARRPAKKPGAIRRSNISRARSLALRFFLIPASRASLPGQVFASPKPSARCW